MNDPTSGVVDWFRWVMGGVGAILSGAGYVIWNRQDKIEDRVESLQTSMSNAMTEHRIEDERQFAKKDELRRVYEIIRQELTDLRENQARNVERIMDKLDQFNGNGPRPRP